MLNGGDDYELIFCAPASAKDEILSLANIHDCPVTQIGEITNSSGLRVINDEGQELNVFESGYRHFG